jgi:hypothetical protein
MPKRLQAQNMSIRRACRRAMSAQYSIKLNAIKVKSYGAIIALAPAEGRSTGASFDD